MRYILVPKADDLGDALAAERTPMRPDVRARRLDTLVRARRSAVERDGRLDALVGRRDAFVIGDPPEFEDALGGRSAQPGFARVAWPPVTVVATPARQPRSPASRFWTRPRTPRTSSATPFPTTTSSRTSRSS